MNAGASASCARASRQSPRHRPAQILLTSSTASESSLAAFISSPTGVASVVVLMLVTLPRPGAAMTTGTAVTVVAVRRPTKYLRMSTRPTINTMTPKIPTPMPTPTSAESPPPEPELPVCLATVPLSLMMV
jgi:hypothetical protein